MVVIHPVDKDPVHTVTCDDLDDKYDVHPPLTTIDALHPVVLIELEMQESLSETVQLVLWGLWREVRYVVIGIRRHPGRGRESRGVLGTPPGSAGGEEDAAGLWVATVEKWTRKIERNFHMMREQIQRHQNVVDNHLPHQVRTRIGTYCPAPRPIFASAPGSGNESPRPCGTANRCLSMTTGGMRYGGSGFEIPSSRRR